MRNTQSRKRNLAIAVLWTLVALVWAIVTVTRFGDPNTVGDSLVLTIFTLLFSLALSILFWVRFARSPKE